MSILKNKRPLDLLKIKYRTQMRKQVFLIKNGDDYRSKLGKVASQLRQIGQKRAFMTKKTKI